MCTTDLKKWISACDSRWQKWAENMFTVSFCSKAENILHRSHMEGDSWIFSETFHKCVSVMVLPWCSIQGTFFLWLVPHTPLRISAILFQSWFESYGCRWWGHSHSHQWFGYPGKTRNFIPTCIRLKYRRYSGPDSRKVGSLYSVNKNRIQWFVNLHILKPHFIHNRT